MGRITHGRKISIFSDFSSETMQAGRQNISVLKMMKGEKSQPRILYLEEISFKKTDKNTDIFGQVKKKMLKQDLFTNFTKFTNLTKRCSLGR